MAVDEGLGEARAGAAHADAVVLVERAFVRAGGAECSRRRCAAANRPRCGRASCSMSSAETTSMRFFASRLASCDFSIAPRMPTTTTVSRSSASLVPVDALSCAKVCPAKPRPARMAIESAVFCNFMCVLPSSLEYRSALVAATLPGCVDDCEAVVLLRTSCPRAVDPGLDMRPGRAIRTRTVSPRAGGDTSSRRRSRPVDRARPAAREYVPAPRASVPCRGTARRSWNEGGNRWICGRMPPAR